VKFRSADYTTLSTTGIIVLLVFTVLATILSFGGFALARPWFFRSKFNGVAKPWGEDENFDFVRECARALQDSTKTDSGKGGGLVIWGSTWVGCQ